MVATIQYTDKLGIRVPDDGWLSWGDEIRDNAEIMSTILSCILNGNHVVSGLAASNGGTLQVDYTSGSASVNGTTHEISAGNKTAAALTDSKTLQRNFLYVDSAGSVQISTTAPTGNYCLLAIIDCSTTAITAVYDCRVMALSNPFISGVQVGNPYRKNLVINGAMEVAQRGTSFVLSGSQYTLDRWKIQVDNNNGTVTQSTDAPAGFANALKIIATGTSTFFQAGQQIEYADMKHLAGQDVTISCYAKGSASNLIVRIRTSTTADTSVLFTGTAQSDTHTITTTYQPYKSKFTIPSDAKALSIEFADSTTWSDTEEIHITGVQIELGDIATGFDYRPAAEELVLCQRFYNAEATFLCGSSDNAGYNPNSYTQRIKFPCEMRIAPSMTFIDAIGGAGVTAYATATATDGLAVTNANISKNGFMVQIATGTANSGLFRFSYAATAEF